MCLAKFHSTPFLWQIRKLGRLTLIGENEFLTGQSPLYDCKAVTPVCLQKMCARYKSCSYMYVFRKSESKPQTQQVTNSYDGRVIQGDTHLPSFQISSEAEKNWGCPQSAVASVHLWCILTSFSRVRSCNQ